jgi:tripartite-type tricarboxylate transporter receptor subunit TctC
MTGNFRMTAIAQEGGDRFWSSTMRRNVLKQLAAVSAAMMLPSMARAQSFPTKPIRIIVGGTPGGTSDILARALANGTQATFGQPVLVEYKPGAATNIGTDFVAKSAPDGHTLLLNG